MSRRGLIAVALLVATGIVVLDVVISLRALGSFFRGNGQLSLWLGFVWGILSFLFSVCIVIASLAYHAQGGASRVSVREIGREFVKLVKSVKLILSRSRSGRFGD
jgi:hypothetical protein